MTRGIIEPLPVTFDEAVKRVVREKPGVKVEKGKKANKSSNHKTTSSKQAKPT